MAEYKMYEVIHTKKGTTRELVKEWDYKPDTKEVDAELRKMHDKYLHDELLYVRAWDPDDTMTKTVFDFGHHIVFAEVEPSVFRDFLNTDPLEYN